MLTRQPAFARDQGLVNQIRRAAVSVMSNISEGFERGATSEFIQFLFIAKGSCGEVRCQLQIARDQNYISMSDYERLCDLARLTSGMISNFIAHLQGSKYKGEKFSRPHRQSLDSRQERNEALRAAQLRNIQARIEREQGGKPIDEDSESEPKN
ncbi:MAG: four helix bundle protein [bacterium]